MKTKPQRHPPPSLPAPACTRTHETLKPLLSIFEAFNHRHRNQHRASHWWTEFSILRRSIRALASDALHRHEAALLHRARWTRAHIIPRSYLAFTQLAADNQHSPLGLMLLAALAQVNTALTELLPDTTTGPSADSRKEPAAAASGSVLETSESASADRGTAVSRDDLSSLRSEAPLNPKPALASGAVVSARPGSPPRKVEKRKSKKKASGKKSDEFASLFGNLN